MSHQAPIRKTYIDLFAGCGGLSLGLQQAGWEGVFAIERSDMAFETLRHNLIDGVPTHYPHWPDWLPKQATSIQQLTDKYARQLEQLRGKVMLIAGGPPCQGFSSAGRRQKNDHRNKLYRSYIEVVRLVRPAIVLLENVTGIKMQFGPRPSKKLKRGRPPIPYSERLKGGLTRLGYKMYDSEVLASAFGVPQSRTRFVAIGIDTNQFGLCPVKSPFEILTEIRAEMLREKSLPIDKDVSCENALSDLEFKPNAIAPSPDTKNFNAGKYGLATSAFQKLMRGNLETGRIADSHRFVNHRDEIITRFEKILKECPLGRKISSDFRKKLNITKVCVVPLSPSKAAVTLTTIPDDMIHYSQPRVLTVRECARLQSFPDWFEFKSKYTTGGDRRKKECPRYTQVGNAVPPLVAEAFGRALTAWISVCQAGEQRRDAA